jgi:hypothetical protein
VGRNPEICGTLYGKLNGTEVETPTMNVVVVFTLVDPKIRPMGQQA